MSTKMCITCGRCEKAKGVHRCAECDLARQPAEAQERAADWRLAAVPPELRRKTVPSYDWPLGRRWCSGCQSFPRLEDCTGSRCKACASRAAHAGMVARTYTIHGRAFTEDDYQFLYRKQGGRCYICQRPSRSKRLAIDHDHGTTNVRGLLCPGDEFGCNLAILGNIKDRAMLGRIVEYWDDPPALRWIKE